MTGLPLYRVRVEVLTVEAMRPFGAVLDTPAMEGARHDYTHWLGSGRRGMSPRLHVNHVGVTRLPQTVERMERHRYSAQIFLPMDVRRYLIVVALSDAEDRPDLETVRAFVVPGEVGILYGEGVWHTGMMVLERAGGFGVLMWRNDSADDEEFVTLATALVVNEAAS